MFDDKVVLITGAGQGIGRQTALDFADQGARVAVNSLNPHKAGDTAQTIVEAGGKASPFPTDVADYDAVQAMVARVEEEMGPVDILINNAGVETHLTVEDMSLADWDKKLSITLGGVFNCAKAVMPSMMARRSGKMVNIGSVASFRVSKSGGADYTTAKHAVLGLTRHLAYELAGHHINVNLVCPGLTITEIIWGRYSKEEVESWSREMLPLGEVGQPKDISDAVLFLASEKARLITGQSLVVDSGIMLVPPGDNYRPAMADRVAVSQRMMDAAGERSGD